MKTSKVSPTSVHAGLKSTQVGVKLPAERGETSITCVGELRDLMNDLMDTSQYLIDKANRVLDPVRIKGEESVQGERPLLEAPPLVSEMRSKALEIQTNLAALSHILDEVSL